ncbi:MAG: hypothetical protein AAB279_05380 [Candidatus Binatota bacterium]
MKEILKDIFTWPWFSEPHGYNFNGYFICHAGGNLCIDPVEPAEETLEELARRGVAGIILTNRNHSRAANQVRARTGGRTAIHPADAPHARSPIARKINTRIMTGCTPRSDSHRSPSPQLQG